MPTAIDTTRTPTLAEVIGDAIDFRLRNTHVMLPGKVLDYDSGSQTATVMPLLKSPVVDRYGFVQTISKPPISHVPVVFPGGGGFRLTFPIQANDTVSLIFSDQSLDLWKSYGGEVDPIDLRIHDIGDCIAFPGLHPDNAAWTSVDGSHVQIGKDGSSAAAVGIAPPNDSNWTIFSAALLACLSSILNAGGPGIPTATVPGITGPLQTLQGALGVPTPLIPPWPQSTGSGIVQILG
jgi:hypothetical protein